MVNFTSYGICNTTLEHQSGKRPGPLAHTHALTISIVDSETKLYGNLNFHDVGLIIAAVFGLIAVLLSFFLMFMHATHYLKPWEQRQ